MVASHEPHEIIRENADDGVILLRSAYEMPAPARRTLDWLADWAERTPAAVFLAERSGPGWREVTYGEAQGQVTALAAALLERGLGPDRPLMIISGNGVDHGLLTLAAQTIGAPVVPVAEQYALIPGAERHLDDIGSRVRPGAVFAVDGDKFGAALTRDVFEDAEKIASTPGVSGATARAFSITRGRCV